jgi:hypothetical protein
MDGSALGSVWTLHDGRRYGGSTLTRLDLAGVLEEATGLLASVRRGCDPSASDCEILRVHRAACLARRSTVVGDAQAALVALIALDQAIADYELAWREMVRVRLPNLVTSLRTAGMCELARTAGWEPGTPHPRWVRACSADR